jgi:hypothetical protein
MRGRMIKRNESRQRVIVIRPAFNPQCALPDRWQHQVDWQDVLNTVD